MGHSREYTDYIRSEVWREKSKAAIAFTGGRCVLFPWLKANHTHHMTYRNFKVELVGRDIVPLSKLSHGIVHQKLLWKSGLRWWVNCYLRGVLPVVVVIGVVFPIKNKLKLRVKK